MNNGDYINAYEDLKESISRSSEYSENLDTPEGTMMTVPEMRKLLGLKKTESYYLVKKQYFETQVVLGKIRINRESFEKWYANQVIYQKVTGEEPGLELKKKSLSPKDIAEMLSLSESYVYEVMDNAGIKPVIVNFHKRFPVEEFQKWYKGQNRYRNAEDRKADEKLLREAISMPEMAKLLGLTRQDVYNIIRDEKYVDEFKFITINEHKYITMDSFEDWYSRQDDYHFVKEYSPVEVALEKDHRLAVYRRRKTRQQGCSRWNGNREYLTMDEAAFLANVGIDTIKYHCRNKKLPCIKAGNAVRISRKEFNRWMKKKAKGVS